MSAKVVVRKTNTPVLQYEVLKKQKKDPLDALKRYKRTNTLAIPSLALFQIGLLWTGFLALFGDWRGG